MGFRLHREELLQEQLSLLEELNELIDLLKHLMQTLS